MTDFPMTEGQKVTLVPTGQLPLLSVGGHTTAANRPAASEIWRRSPPRYWHRIGRD